MRIPTDTGALFRTTQLVILDRNGSKIEEGTDWQIPRAKTPWTPEMRNCVIYGREQTKNLPETQIIRLFCLGQEIFCFCDTQMQMSQNEKILNKIAGCLAVCN